MAFHTAEYDVYALLSDAATQPLWYWDQWRLLMPALDALLHAARGPASIRITQLLPDRRKTVKFGRIGWKELDQQKWTHYSPRTMESCSTWTFQDAELWAPAWTQCERDKSAPDIFMAISGNIVYKRSTSFGPVIVFAVRSELYSRQNSLVASVVKQLRELVKPKLVAHIRRTWGRSMRDGLGFFDSLQELHILGLFRIGPLENLPVDLGLFEDKWELVP
jgi:hypothetical protein